MYPVNKSEFSYVYVYDYSKGGKMIYFRLGFVFFVISLIAGCSTLTLKPAEFSWPIESVLKIDKDGTVNEDRYSVSFNTKALFFEETKDSMAYAGKDLRVIRNMEGYYFITSQNFKNVYVFASAEGSLKLENKITISEIGMKNPVFNQRTPYIELVIEISVVNLNKDGIVRGEK